MSLHVEAWNQMYELNTFEGGEKPCFAVDGAKMVLRSVDQRPQHFFKQAIIKDSHDTGYGSRHTAEA